MELNIFSILAATFLSMALGVIWYSPYVCGAYWERALGSVMQAEPTSTELVRQYVFGFLAQFALFGALAYLLHFFTVRTEYELRIVLCACSLIAGVVTARVSIFEKIPPALSVINVVYTIGTLVAGGYVIMYWPW